MTKKGVSNMRVSHESLIADQAGMWLGILLDKIQSGTNFPTGQYSTTQVS
jgi:hypothetical protein